MFSPCFSSVSPLRKPRLFVYTLLSRVCVMQPNEHILHVVEQSARLCDQKGGYDDGCMRLHVCEHARIGAW